MVTTARVNSGADIGSNPVLTTKMKTSRNMEYVKTNFLSENDKLIGLSLGISKINSQVVVETFGNVEWPQNITR